MKPPLLLLFLLSFLHLAAASLCAPRSLPHDRILSDFSPPPNHHSVAASPSHSPPSWPPTPSSPLHSPTPARAPSSKTSTSSPAPAPIPPFSAKAKTSAAVVDPIVNDICAKTDFPDLCTTSVQAVATGPAPDARAVLKLALKASAARTRPAVERATALAADPRNDEQTKAILMVCMDAYDKALSDNEEASDALDTDSDIVVEYVSAMYSDYGDCSDAFSEAGIASPLQAIEDHLRQMAGNCLRISKMV